MVTLEVVVKEPVRAVVELGDRHSQMCQFSSRIHIKTSQIQSGIRLCGQQEKLVFTIFYR